MRERERASERERTSERQRETVNKIVTGITSETDNECETVRQRRDYE